MCLALDNRHSVTVTYIDYSKAFDMLSHSNLLHTLSCFGIRGNLLRWIGEFLHNRTQCVRVGSAISYPKQLISGVVYTRAMSKNRCFPKKRLSTHTMHFRSVTGGIRVSVTQPSTPASMEYKVAV